MSIQCPNCDSTRFEISPRASFNIDFAEPVDERIEMDAIDNTTLNLTCRDCYQKPERTHIEMVATALLNRWLHARGFGHGNGEIIFVRDGQEKTVKLDGTIVPYTG